MCSVVCCWLLYFFSALLLPWAKKNSFYDCNDRIIAFHRAFSFKECQMDSTLKCVTLKRTDTHSVSWPCAFSQWTDFFPGTNIFAPKCFRAENLFWYFLLLHIESLSDSFICWHKMLLPELHHFSDRFRTIYCRLWEKGMFWNDWKMQSTYERQKSKWRNENYALYAFNSNNKKRTKTTTTLSRSRYLWQEKTVVLNNNIFCYGISNIDWRQSCFAFYYWCKSTFAIYLSTTTHMTRWFKCYLFQFI